MFKKIAAILLILVSLTGCNISPTSGLQSYVDSTDGYQFLYPNGWVEMKVSSGPDVVFRDLIESTENASVVFSPVTNDKTLADLGTPSEVGYKLSKSAIAPPGSGREAELISAEKREAGDKTYYILEYAVTLPNQKRHNIASVAVSRGKLFTFNASTAENRWPKVADTFHRMINSFAVY